MLKLFLLTLSACVLLAAAFLWVRRETVASGAQAYLFGYPLVIVDLTRRQAALQIGPENELRRVRRFPDATFRGVVRPNVDTLYTHAFIDMARGPWVFESPPNDQRYELMPFMDAWTDVFAAPGTRTSGTGGNRLLLVGPQWQGPAPAGLTPLRAPTRWVWLIARTQTNGVADYPLVHRLQDGMSLRSLVDWEAGRTPAASGWQPAATPAKPPVEQLREMSTQAFFAQLAQLMVDNPPKAADAPMLARMAELGLAAGQAPQWSTLDGWLIALGRRIADWRINRELRQPRNTVRGWSTPPDLLGQYGTNYAVRAAVAMAGLGANLVADAMYPSARVDERGETLDGSRRYRLHFRAGELPPVRAFWSVTAYGNDDFLLEHPTARHALGDRDPLVFNPDGSLDLWIQADAPVQAHRANWLPVRAGQAFLLTARLYWPKETALKGEWGMPAVQRIESEAR